MRVLMIASAAIRQRVRQFSFWAMAGLFLASAFLFVPKREETGFDFLILDPDTFLQAGNPTWVPMAAALCMSLFLMVFGFAYIRGMVTQDRDTGTMELMLAGRMGRFSYVFGKLLASFALLLMLLLIVMAGSLITTLIQYPGQFMGPWAFVSPYLALVPGLLQTAALALVMETAALFRSGRLRALGMVLYFGLVVASMSVGITLTGGADSAAPLVLDMTGMGWLMAGVDLAAIAAVGRPVETLTVMGGGLGHYTGTVQLYFDGLPREESIFLAMALVAAAAVALTLLAGLFLERRPLEGPLLSPPEREEPAHTGAPARGDPWRPVPAGRYRLSDVVGAELRRIVRDLGPGWRIVATGLWVTGWAVNLETARGLLLPLLLGWAILPLSNLGGEERATGVEELFRTVPGGPVRQGLASAAAGCLLCVGLALPQLVRSAGSGFLAVPVLLALCLALPFLALALGGYTGTQRPYQILLIFFLYLVLNSPETFLPTDGDRAAAAVIGYLLVAGVSLAAVLVRRWRAQR